MAWWGARRRAPEESTDGLSQTAVHELACVFNKRDQAVQLVLDSGFPQTLVPDFTTPASFWSAVAAEVRNGALPEGAQCLIEKAAGMYPANPVFASCCGTDERPDSRSAVGRPTDGLRDLANAKLAEAQTNLMSAQAFQDLADAADRLEQAGHRVVIEDVDGESFRITIRRD